MWSWLMTYYLYLYIQDKRLQEHKKKIIILEDLVCFLGEILTIIIK